MAERETDDYDSPWKEAIETYFREFVEFFFPHAAREIDWARGWEFLDQELRQVLREAEAQRRVVDKLARVWLAGGAEAWVLAHVEVQSQREGEFERRMFTCNYRLFDRYQRRVATLVVLGDEHPGWRPARFGYELWGCRVEFSFPAVKLLDLRPRWAELEGSRNPFAVVVMAHLETQRTRGDNQSRFAAKRQLVRSLYEYGYTADQVRGIFRFIDWLMRLPEGLEQNLRRELVEYEAEKSMPYITSIERLAIQDGVERGLQQGLEQGLQQGLEQGLEQGLQQGLEQGLQQGLQEGTKRQLLRLLERRFGPVPESLSDRLAGLSVEQLEALVDEALAATTLDDFISHLPTAG
jgi:hypothetical protein